MRNLILTGFMGTGKSTVAGILAGRYGWRLIDTDLEVERRVGSSVQEIWTVQGEAAFRSVEAVVLHGALRAGGNVIATGAGALLGPTNRAMLQPGDIVVCLTCHVDALRERLRDRRDRPLLSDLADDELVAAVERLLEQRGSVYHLYPQIDTTCRTPEDVARDIGDRFRLGGVGEISFDQTVSSQVCFGRGALDNIATRLTAAHLDGPFLLVTDENVHAAGWPDRIADSLISTGHNVEVEILPAGEEHKTLACLERIYRAAMERRLDRDAIVLAVGGGVIGDLGGMAAATYLRGLRLVQVPTTLVAQVDAAIGGKVGVDLAGGKNLIGAFYPASLVLIDPDVLMTVPRSRLSDGLAEMVKISAVRSASFLQDLESVNEPGDIRQSAHLIRRAVEEKLALVAADPYDHAERMLLNFGHTVGHGLEAAALVEGVRADEAGLSHGQAVSVGMIAEARLGEAKGWTEPGLTDRLASLLGRFGLPITLPCVNVESAAGFIAQDKKRAHGAVRMAVPAEMGRGIVVTASDDDVRSALAHAAGSCS